MSRRLLVVCGLISWFAGPLAAQGPVDQGVRIGITYAPGTRPGMLVLGGTRGTVSDSVRAILSRDLDFSDQFEMIYLPGGDSLAIGGSGGDADTENFVNYQLYTALGAHYAVSITERPDSGLNIDLYDVRGEVLVLSARLETAGFEETEFRQDVHRMSDEVVRVAAGAVGSAATRLLWVRSGELRVVDSDAHGDKGLRTAGKVYSPAWHPNATDYAYIEFPGSSTIHLGTLDSGDLRTITDGLDGQDFAPVFGPQGSMMVFSRAAGDGTDLYSYDLIGGCCLQRLTVGRFSDNLSPTFSPDGRRLAYVSTRSGLPQIYVMAADGTGQELFAPFDYGVTGGSYAPEWSPDGLNLAFHRDVAGSPQVFIMDVATRTVRQLTSAGRNEDPTWAPDSRHLAFVSSRTGSSQIWVIDLDTGRTRQVTRGGRAKLPAWSRLLTRSE